MPNNYFSIAGYSDGDSLNHLRRPRRECNRDRAAKEWGYFSTRWMGE